MRSMRAQHAHDDNVDAVDGSRAFGQGDLHVAQARLVPLHGLPQGPAPYHTGVRLNEPFGDTINWDLLPANAVAAVNIRCLEDFDIDSVPVQHFDGRSQ